MSLYQGAQSHAQLWEAALRLNNFVKIKFVEKQVPGCVPGLDDLPFYPIQPVRLVG